MTRIGISGSYGGLNLGDEAILTAAIAELRATFAASEITVFSRNAEHTARSHEVDHVVCPRTALQEEILPEIERLDLFLLGGGGILYDGEARTYLREVKLAQERGVPTFAYAVGIGPLKDKDERRTVREACNRMAGITVREVGAKRLMEQIGVEQSIAVTADPALLLTPVPFTEEMLRTEGIPVGDRLVGISIREQGPAAPDLNDTAYHRLLADAADFIIHRFNARAVFVPMEAADLHEAHRVIARMAMPHRTHVLKNPYGPRQILGLMQHLEMAVGMRLHFLIFAALAGIPLIALPYAPKLMDFLDRLGLPERSAVQQEHAGSLLADLDRLWDERQRQRQLLRDRVRPLKEAARQTAPLAAAILRSGPQPMLPLGSPESQEGESLAASATPV